MTTMGQPLVPFRTDDWPLDDIGRSGKHPAAMHPPLPADFRVPPVVCGIAPLILRLHCGRHRPSARGVMSSGGGGGLRRVGAVPRRIMPSASEPDGAFLLPEIGIMMPCICIY